MVNERKAGLASPSQTPFGKAGLDYTQGDSVQFITAGASPHISLAIRDFKDLVYVRYYDHVLFNRTSAMIMAPIVREAIGWLVYECEQYLTLVLDRDARPPTLKGSSDPKATGLVLLRLDIVEFKRFKDFLPLQNSLEWAFNSQGALPKKREYAHLDRGSEKLPKKLRKGE
jgi:hypothetical protein